MKTFFIVILTIFTMIFIFNKNDDVETSFNDKGDKVIKVTCYYEEECLEKIGNECKDIGYKIINKNYSSITAICGGNLSLINLIKLKVIKVISYF